jgi:hypothetical protein
VKRADVIAVAAALLMVLGAVAGGALAHDRPAQMKRMAAADGVLSLSNSLDDGAVITARGLLPGQSATGTVTIGNAGEVDGTLGLARTWIDDAPGPNGGRLSDVLTLLIEDISAARPREVLYGEVGGLERMALERLPAGVRRTYRFTVGFPDSGPHGADNAYIGSALRMDYEWRAEPLPAAAATPVPTPVATPVTTPVAPAPVQGRSGAPTPVTAPKAAPRITIRVPHQRVVHTDAVRLFARCDVSCRVRFAGRVVTAPKRKRARRVVLLRKRAFRGEKKARILPVTAERALRLKLSRKGRRVLRRALDSRGRVAVVITASVRGAGGRRRVRKRIVLHTTLIRNGHRVSYR